MMRPSNEGPDVFLRWNPVDFRKGINGLAALVEAEMGQYPFAKRLFVFCNRRRNRVKIQRWERNGFCLWQKRLEDDRFPWPRQGRDEVIALSAQRLNRLLDGYDILKLQTSTAALLNGAIA